MPDYPHLKRAPIAEALLDVRVELPAAIDYARLEEFSVLVAQEFPDAKPMSTTSVEIVGGAQPHVTQRQNVGRIGWSADGGRAVQARTDGFTYNLVKNYQSWPLMREPARRLWESYVALVRPVRVLRCGLRYINRIRIQAGRDLTEYLRAVPTLPDEISPVVSEYLTRVVVPFELDRQAILTQSLSHPNADGAGDLILDIDVFVEGDRPLGAVWQEFEALRELKNRCFFGSMQPAALEAFK